MAAGDILGLNDIHTVGAALTDLASATVDAALAVVRASRETQAVPRIAVIAMGRWGGGEMSYASDADAMFVMDDESDPFDRPHKDRGLRDHRDAAAAGQAQRRSRAEH